MALIILLRNALWIFCSWNADLQVVELTNFAVKSGDENMVSDELHQNKNITIVTRTCLPPYWRGLTEDMNNSSASRVIQMF